MNDQQYNDYMARATEAAYDLGCAVEYVKFASVQHEAVRDRMMSLLSPYHRELLGCLQEVGGQVATA